MNEPTALSELPPVSAWLSDMDGVLVKENRALPGANEFLAALRANNIPFLVLTNNSVFTKVVVTDTIPSGERLDVCSKLQVVSVASLLAKSIHNIHTGSSVSVLF